MISTINSHLILSKKFWLKLPLIIPTLLVVGLTACDQQDQTLSSEQPTVSTTEPSSSKARKSEAAIEYKTIEWTDLMPKSDLDAILNPPSYINNIEDGSADDKISSNIQSKPKIVKDDPYQQALVSRRILPEMNNQPIRLPGFIVPLTFNDSLAVTQFFLVPFFGACIHLPPPPPNQIIFVNYPKGLALENIYNPYWVSGVLKTKLVENETATAAYSMQMQSFEIYTEELTN